MSDLSFWERVQARVAINQAKRNARPLWKQLLIGLGLGVFAALLIANCQAMDS
ncbi:hypothetical protein KZZ52_07120 [Dactylosporangium sp. AC04546]|uniref:hypothetical protein n=1 Tax=Dactylosporangium sp. AC04546 TaxID=2862460 RepID=UPI001EDFD487|nr:hypothetical protein [Dactylosporangium sp. AC04546]WVK85165.1 hypothetical protein KZZ52_07120 [Dactylosporangium sp. AC04546]